MSSEIALQMHGIRKCFGTIIANDGAGLTVRRGTIHALVGENGSGKTTLMKIAFGLLRPDKGTVKVDGEQVELKSPIDAIRHRIYMVQQHFSLIPSFKVVEMVGLLHPASRNTIYHPEKVKADVEHLSKVYGLEVNSDLHVWQLSVGERQRVEIIKALIVNAKILLLDEPSAVLTPVEVRRLFSALKAMAANLTVVVATHRMDEVIDLCDELTILRKGKNVFDGKVSGMNIKGLTELIVGKELDLCENPSKMTELNNNPVALETRNLKVKGDMGHLAVNDVSLKVRKGEILGVAGESGNGQKELAEAIYGLRKIETGNLFLFGKDITHATAREMFESGVHYIPEERFLRGGCKSFSIADNSILNRYRYEPFSRNHLIARSERDSFARDLIERFDVRAENYDKPLQHLSGGNIQKIISGRELAGDFDVLIAFHPTSGLDVSAISMLHSSILNLKQNGKAIMLLDEDLNEILAMSDRIVVISRGRIVAEKNRCDTNMNQLGSIIAGIEA